MDLITNKIISDNNFRNNSISFVPSLKNLHLNYDNDNHNDNHNDNNNHKIIKLNKKQFVNNCEWDECNGYKLNTDINILNTSVGDNYRDIVKNRKNILSIRKKTNAKLNLLNKKINEIKNTMIEGTIYVSLGIISYYIYNLV